MIFVAVLNELVISLPGFSRNSSSQVNFLRHMYYVTKEELVDFCRRMLTHL